MTRSTEEHRNAIEAWRATAPTDDIELWEKPKKAKGEKSRRHRGLAELSALLEFYRRPVGVAEGVPSEELPTVKSNWRLSPANDNKVQEEGCGREKAFEYIPSLAMIERSLKDVDVFERPEPVMLSDGHQMPLWNSAAHREVHANPVAGDIEYGYHIDDRGKRHKTIVRIGRLRFSNGNQTEKGLKLVMGEVVEAEIAMPVGAMLGCREKATRDKGSVADPVEVALSNHYFAGRPTENMPGGLFQAKKPRRVKRKAGPEERRNITKAEARQMLADAIANTPVLPEVKRCPTGFPAGPTQLAQLWPGLVKVATGDSGSQGWEDVYSERAEAEEFAKWLQGMKDEHVQTLTQAMSARSLQELGESRGYSGKYAIAAGRRLLVAANDNFQEAKKIASTA